MALFRFAVLIVTFMVASVVAQVPTAAAHDVLLDRLVGRWIATGTIAVTDPFGNRFGVIENPHFNPDAVR